MLYIAVALFLIASVPLAYWTIVFFQKYEISRFLINRAVAYQVVNTDYTRTLLILGDSTGVGVGALQPEDSVAGRLAKAMDATYIENRAVSGAVAADVGLQLSDALLPRYNVILIQVGANDIVRFHDTKAVAAQLLDTIQNASKRSDATYLMSAGDLGATTNFPSPMRPFYTKLTLRYHAAFEKMAKDAGVVYINLYMPPEEDPFVKDPNRYLSIDGFHPSSDGYGLWFDRLWEVAKTNI
jgi:lysophospholipase L1-like esterase